MDVDLGEFGLGIVSLFPLIGRIERLRGFFPQGMRNWFVTLSTIFSLVVYLAITLRFDKLRFFVPILWSTLIAAAAMIGYIVVHLALKGRRRALTGPLRGISIGLMLVLYTVAIALLTYTFNTLKQLQTFAVYQGTVLARDSGPLPGAELSFMSTSGSTRQTATNGKGKFFAIIERKTLSALEVNHGRPDRPSYCRSWTADQVPADEYISLILEPCGG